MYRLFDTEQDKFLIIDDWKSFTFVEKEPFLYDTLEEAETGLQEAWKRHDKYHPDNNHNRDRYIIKEI